MEVLGNLLSIRQSVRVDKKKNDDDDEDDDDDNDCNDFDKYCLHYIK